MHTQQQSHSCLICKLLKFIDNSPSEQEPGNVKATKLTNKKWTNFSIYVNNTI